MVTDKGQVDESKTTTEQREFCRVVDWELYQYADVRKKPTPPWKWFRIQRAFLSSPEWLAMTTATKVDFVHLLGAASETGNMIPLDRNWLRFRQLSEKKIQKLEKFSVVEAFSLPADDTKIKQLRQILSGAFPPPEAETETETQKSESQPAGPVPDLSKKDSMQ